MIEDGQARQFLTEFQDYLAPKLDTYEQAIYLYVYRHSRLIGEPEAVIGFKSARHRLACGIGVDGSVMSESTAYKKLASLALKRALTIVRTEHAGRRIRLHTPSEIDGLIPKDGEQIDQTDIEHWDFFENPENRAAIFRREGGKCFYTLQLIDEANAVLDHIVSRPAGTNSYTNLVAASREANNRKGAMGAEEFLRSLLRGRILSLDEYEERLLMLDRVKSGNLKPIFL